MRAGSRGEFQLRSHDSFKISERTSLWHWKSRDIGGRSALDYLIHVEGRSFVEAVLTLSEEAFPTRTQLPKAEPKRELVLPPAAENNRRVFAYLMQRGIDRRVIESCVRSGLLYESAAHHNAVFVGRDESGVPRYVWANRSNVKRREATSAIPSAFRPKEKAGGRRFMKPPWRRLHI